jgi:putative FmdB family regulatory protein
VNQEGAGSWRAHRCDVPTYDYQCRQCGTKYEVIHSMLEDGPTTCEKCGGQLRRVLYPSGIIFKGSGFYKTDSRSSSGSSSHRAPADSSSSVADGAGASDGAKDGGKTGDGAKASENTKSSGSDSPSAPKSAE